MPTRPRPVPLAASEDDKKKKGKRKKRRHNIYIYIYFIASKSWLPNARRAGVGGEFETRGASRGAEPEVTREGVGESRAAGRAGLRPNRILNH